MGTREVYEEKLRTGNLDHDPTLNPGLGSPRCPRCLSLLNPNSERGEWTITPVLHDATAVVSSSLPNWVRFEAGSGIGGMLSAVHSLNTGLPYLQKGLKGPKWLPFVVGIPPLLIFSGLSAAFGGSSNDKAIEPNREVDHISSLSQKNPANWKVYSRRKKRPDEHWKITNKNWLKVHHLPQFLAFSLVFCFSVLYRYVLPKFTQLTVTSYYAASSGSHYGISLLTRHIEENYSSKTHIEENYSSKTQHLKRL
ncbi:hypothetical protein ACSQ67_015801 [Phaseolus vulgaris]